MCKCSILVTEVLCAGCHKPSQKILQREWALGKNCKVHNSTKLPTNVERQTKYVEDPSCRYCQTHGRTAAYGMSAKAPSRATSRANANEEYIQLPVRSHNDGSLRPQQAYLPSRAEAASGTVRATRTSHRSAVPKLERSDAVLGTARATGISQSHQREGASTQRSRAASGTVRATGVPQSHKRDVAEHRGTVELRRANSYAPNPSGRVASRASEMAASPSDAGSQRHGRYQRVEHSVTRMEATFTGGGRLTVVHEQRVVSRFDREDCHGQHQVTKTRRSNAY